MASFLRISCETPGRAWFGRPGWPRFCAGETPGWLRFFGLRPARPSASFLRMGPALRNGFVYSFRGIVRKERRNYRRLLAAFA